jgi:outer membrane receptor protein involved in Fe transport
VAAYPAEQQNLASQTWRHRPAARLRIKLPSAGSLDLAFQFPCWSRNPNYAGANPYDCAGLFGLTCQTVNPDWRHIFRTTWQTPWNVMASMSWRYIGPVDQDNNDSNPSLQNQSYAGFDSFNDHIGSKSYFDLAATYSVSDSVEVRAGINNLFDKDPPLVGSDIISGGAPNTYETYDLFGREIFIGVTAKL